MILFLQVSLPAFAGSRRHEDHRDLGLEMFRIIKQIWPTRLSEKRRDFATGTRQRFDLEGAGYPARHLITSLLLSICHQRLRTIAAKVMFYREPENSYRSIGSRHSVRCQAARMFRLIHGKIWKEQASFQENQPRKKPTNYIQSSTDNGSPRRGRAADGVPKRLDRTSVRY